jgi:hypothetical protein
MRKCHLINVPWLFNTVWWVIKGWLATKTIEKIGVLGSSYHSALQVDISMDNLPSEVGGNYSKTADAFPFDLSEGGMLHTPGSSSLQGEAASLATETDAA